MLLGVQSLSGTDVDMRSLHATAHFQMTWIQGWLEPRMRVILYRLKTQKGLKATQHCASQTKHLSLVQKDQTKRHLGNCIRVQENKMHCCSTCCRLLQSFITKALRNCSGGINNGGISSKKEKRENKGEKSRGKKRNKEREKKKKKKRGKKKKETEKKERKKKEKIKEKKREKGKMKKEKKKGKKEKKEKSLPCICSVSCAQSMTVCLTR